MQNNIRPSGEKLRRLQTQYPVLRFFKTIVDNEDDGTLIRFIYDLNEVSFETIYRVPLVVDANDPVIGNLLKYLGIVESFSYWKLTCSPQIRIEHYNLTAFERDFFNKLLLKGMGEFLFTNELPLDLQVEFKASGKNAVQDITKTSVLDQTDGALLLVGGGKDSIVSLETLRVLEDIKGVCEILPFSLNPIRASIDCINESKIKNSIFATRTIDKKIFDLNGRDYFNGHIPFSAVLSFFSSIIAQSLKLKFVIASNEASANQGNTVSGGIEVNHQYSKSVEYENDLADLFSEIRIPITYFSLLRPLNEIQISRIFASYEKYHGVFQSCNVQQTLLARQRNADNQNLSNVDRWCGECPKCIFVYLMLNLFLSRDKLFEIFGRHLDESKVFLDVAKQLSKSSEIKPFECVGTFEEVEFALRYYSSKDRAGFENELSEFLKFWNVENRVPKIFEAALKKQLLVKV